MDYTRSSIHHRYAPLSPVSAAQPLLAWIADHGRWPKWRECHASQGLLQGQTYYRYFQASTFSQVVERAQAVIDGRPTSGWIMVTPAIEKTKVCLGGCGTMIRDEGPHVRFCGGCRRRTVLGLPLPSVQEGDMLEPVFTAMQRRRLGLIQERGDAWELIEL